MLRTSMFFVSALVCTSMLSACEPREEVAAEPGAGVEGSEAEAALEAELNELRSTLERFRDVEVALAEGYIPDPMNSCEVAEMMGHPPEVGAMGVHYFRPDLLQVTAIEPRVDGTGTHIDFAQPGVLIYEPQADGSMELVAVENLAFMRAWHEAGHTSPPTFGGVEFDRMEDDPATAVDEGHHFEPHYDLHVWLFRDNPSGTFAQFNPAVTCEHHVGGHGHAMGEGGHGG